MRPEPVSVPEPVPVRTVRVAGAGAGPRSRCPTEPVSVPEPVPVPGSRVSPEPVQPGAGAIARVVIGMIVGRDLKHVLGQVGQPSVTGNDRSESLLFDLLIEVEVLDAVDVVESIAFLPAGPAVRAG